jgi:hemoglobin
MATDLAPDPGIDEGELARLVPAFYTRIRADAELGPIFNDAVENWPEHFGRLTDFWTSIMLGTGRYKSNPVAAHRKHAARIAPEMFDRWLAIWKATTGDMMSAGGAAALQDKAARIAESLKLALYFKLPPKGDRA